MSDIPARLVVAEAELVVAEEHYRLTKLMARELCARLGVSDRSTRPDDDF